MKYVTSDKRRWIRQVQIDWQEADSKSDRRWSIGEQYFFDNLLLQEYTFMNYLHHKYWIPSVPSKTGGTEFVPYYKVYYCVMFYDMILYNNIS